MQGDPSGDLYALKPGTHVPAEGDVRKLLSPDMWCAHESMAIGQARLKDTGLKHIPTLAQIHPDHLRLAYEQLPPSSVRCLACPSWCLAAKMLLTVCSAAPAWQQSQHAAQPLSVSQ